MRKKHRGYSPEKCQLTTMFLFEKTVHQMIVGKVFRLQILCKVIRKKNLYLYMMPKSELDLGTG